MQETYKKKNGVITLDEEENYLLLLGKEGLYHLDFVEGKWRGKYILPGTENKIRIFVSKEVAMQDVYETDTLRRKEAYDEFLEKVFSF